MSAEASTMPLNPFGANGWMLSLLKAVTPTTMKIASTTSLMATITVFTRALWRTPAISSMVIASTTKTAGTLTSPPSPGGFAIAEGSDVLNAESSSSLKYWPQPTAIAATETPYSRIRSQPMIQATSSPIVAYEYVYALPETGIVDASSAYDSAEKMHVTPARMNDRTIAGPESPIPSPMITKMPVPMIAPRPSAVRSSAPTARRSPCS